MSEQISMTYRNLYINGEWVEPIKNGQIECMDPSTGEVWGAVAEATEEDIDRAVEAATEAFENGPWREFSGSERGKLLRKLAGLVEGNGDLLAQIETKDAGIHIRDSRNYVQALADTLYYYAGLADKLEGSTIPVRPNLHAYTVREPVGVVGAITPWNAPLLMYSWKLAPALAAGNTVVLKPAEQTPASALELAHLIDKAGFPPGVVNVVPGFGKNAGAHLVSHPKVNKIAFTGENTTGVGIMKSAAETMKRVTFELGGKAPNIIFDDANLDKAVPMVVNASFLAAGQSCSLGSRLFVHDKIYDEFMDRYLTRASQVKAGNPFDMSAQIGPQASEEQVSKTMRYIEIGKNEGAKIALGGTRPTEDGYYVNPTVFTDVEPSMRIAQEEIFGPVVSVIRFKDEQELIKKANDVVYGLSSAVWTQDISRAHRVAKELRAGTVWINTYRMLHYMLPYGGFKMSGLSWELAQLAGTKHPFLAPITVILCLQATTQKSLIFMIKRIFGTLFGILLIVIGIHYFGLGDQAWKITLLMFVALAICKLIKMDDLTIREAAISIVLVFFLQSRSSVYAMDRARDTLIGAGVALVFLLLILPLSDFKKAKKAFYDFSNLLSSYAISISHWLKKENLEASDIQHLEDNVKTLFEELEQTRSQIRKSLEDLRFNLYARHRRKELNQYIQGEEKLENGMLYLCNIGQSLKKWSDSGTMAPSERVYWANYMEQAAKYIRDWRQSLELPIPVLQNKPSLPNSEAEIRYRMSAESDGQKLIDNFRII